MNRNFFADDDPECKLRLTEVELIRQQLKNTVVGDKKNLELFLDIHSHSAQTSIFVFCPQVDSQADQQSIKLFARILDSHSEFFQFSKCRFGNEVYKKNCARLGVLRDYNLNNSFTIEASCYAFDVKETTITTGPKAIQFKENHLLAFGEHLVQGIARHLDCDVNEVEQAGMCHGFDIELDYALYQRDPKNLSKRKIKKSKPTPATTVKKVLQPKIEVPTAHLQITPTDKRPLEPIRRDLVDLNLIPSTRLHETGRFPGSPSRKVVIKTNVKHDPTPKSITYYKNIKLHGNLHGMKHMTVLPPVDHSKSHKFSADSPTKMRAKDYSLLEEALQDHA